MREGRACVAMEMVKSDWIQVKIWIFIMWLMMTHLPVLGQCVRYYILSKVMQGPQTLGSLLLNCLGTHVVRWESSSFLQDLLSIWRYCVEKSLKDGSVEGGWERGHVPFSLLCNQNHLSH